MKIAMFLPNWIGDAVMATPALRAVRTEYPDAEIVGIHRPVIGDVIAGTHLVNRSLVWNPKGSNRRQRGLRIAVALRRERFDVAVLFPNSLRSAWMAWLSGAKRRIGFRRDGRGWLLNDGLDPKPKSPPHPVIEEYRRLAEHLGCRQLSRQMEVATNPDDEKQWRDFQNVHRSPLSWERYIGLNPGGAFGAAKHWPTDHFAELARRMADELSRTVIVLCGPAERETARDIARLADRRSVIAMADVPPSIGLTKAAVKHAELLVTTDSGPRHFAPPNGVPVITLFGPTHIAWSETYSAKAVHLQQAVDCGPCQQRECPLQHHRCMTELRVERVFANVVGMLERFGSQTRQRQSA